MDVSLSHPQEEKAVIKADMDERQAFADRLGLSLPVAKEAESDVTLAKRTAFHHSGQSSPCHWVYGCRTSRLEVCTAPPPPAPITLSAKRRAVRAQPILATAPDVDRRRRSLLALRSTVGASPTSGAAGGEGSGVRQRRTQLGILTRSQIGKDAAAS